jgi:predicted AlkP superfamily phosphohydrolase/phosphomutase
VIGLDGATFDVLDRWVASGDMPHLAGLMARGSRCRLISTIPPVTGPAWTSMTTGVGPGTHGVFDFLKRTPGTGEARVVESGDVSVPRIWDVAGAHGLSVGALGVPVTFPAQPLNGFLVAGMLAPRSGEEATFPRRLAGELAREGLDVVEASLPLSASARLRAILRGQAQAEKAADYLLRRFSPDFFMVVFREMDRLQHWFWTCCAQDPAAKNGALHAGVREFFRAADRAVGLLTAHFGPDATYYVVSDHGFGPGGAVCALNRYLSDCGLLSFDARRARRGALKAVAAWTAKRLLGRVGLLRPAERALAGLVGSRRVSTMSRDVFGPWAGAVQWDRTLAFVRSRSDYGAWVNLRGREPHGIVEPGARYEKVRSDLIAALRELADPSSGDKLVSGIWPREEIVKGPHLAEAPDIYFSLRGGAIGRDLSLTAPVLRQHPRGWGTHRQDGVLVACGPGLKPGSAADAQIADVAPTVLYGMGLPVPAHVEGQVLTGLFADEHLSRHPVEKAQHPAAGAAGPPQAPSLSAADAEEVQSRLRDLGYL